MMKGGSEVKIKKESPARGIFQSKNQVKNSRVTPVLNAIVIPSDPLHACSVPFTDGQKIKKNRTGTDVRLHSCGFTH